MPDHTRFGVAGNPPNFWSSQFRKDRANSPEWLRSIGLDALEVQCTYGVRMSDKSARMFREASLRFDIALSVHAPYYINLGSSNHAKISNSLNELRKAVALATKLGSTRVVFHPGSIEGDRESARRRAVDALRLLEKSIDFDGVYLFPEIGGKVGQLGSLDDILTMCEAVQCARPCLDLAHLHAREHGCLRDRQSFASVLDSVESRLGRKALSHLHVHLYPVDWGVGGEIEHKAFSDRMAVSPQMSLFEPQSQQETPYLPRYESFLQLICERGARAVIICEAKDSQDVGALEMKRYYDGLRQKAICVETP